MAEGGGSILDSVSFYGGKGKSGIEDLDIAIDTLQNILAVAFPEFAKAIFIFGDWIQDIIGLFFDEPAGSGGVFRKAATDLLPQIDVLSRKMDEEGFDIIYHRPSLYPAFVKSVLQKISPIQEQISANFVKYEGSNLLGATFFGTWVNDKLSRDVFNSLFAKQAEVVKEVDDMFHRRFVEAEKRLDALDGSGQSNTVIADLQKRIADLEFLQSKHYDELKASIKVMVSDYRLLGAKLTDVITGKIPVTDAYARGQIVLLKEMDAKINAILKTVPKNITSTYILNQFKALTTSLQGTRVNVSKLTSQMNKLLQTTIPGLQKGLASAQQQLKTLQTVTLPGIQKTLQGHTQKIADVQGQLNKLGDQVKEISAVQLPALKKELQGQITTLQSRLNGLIQRVEKLEDTLLDRLLDLETALDVERADRSDGDIEACDCAVDRVKDVLPSVFNPATVLMMLCKADGVGDAIADNLFRCVGEKTKPTVGPPEEGAALKWIEATTGTVVVHGE